jgi:hypothetical protein
MAAEDGGDDIPVPAVTAAAIDPEDIAEQLLSRLHLEDIGGCDEDRGALSSWPVNETGDINDSEIR